MRDFLYQHPQNLNLQELTTLVEKVTPQWLAGFFDGEGCVHAKKTEKTTTVSVEVCQSNPEVIFLISLRFGGRFVTRTQDNKSGTISTKYTLIWNGRGCIPILQYLKDYSIVKRKQIALALQLLDFVLDSSHDGSQNNFDIRNKLGVEISTLNQKHKAEVQ